MLSQDHFADLRSTLEDGRGEEVLAAARALRLEAAARRDAAVLGWARYHEIKALYETKRFSEAYQAYWRTESMPYFLPTTNAAWLASIAMELAMRVGAPPDEIISHGEQALSHRRSAGDEHGAIATRQTLCAILAETYPERAAPFAAELFAMAKDDTTRLRAVRWLLKSHDSRPRSETRALLEQVRETLLTATYRKRDAMLALVEARVRTSERPPPASGASSEEDAETRLKFALAAPTSTFAAQCALGEIGDAFLTAGACGRAEHTYAELLRRIDATRTYDTYVMAKLTLGMLLALIGQGRDQEAMTIWLQEPGERPYGLGIYTLEQGGTSVEDLEIYFLVSAHLHSLNPDRAKAEEAVTNFMQRVTRYACEERREWLDVVVADWKRLLRQIHGGPPPISALAPVMVVERAIARTVPEASAVRFPTTSPWAITWGDGTVTELTAEGFVRRVARRR